MKVAITGGTGFIGRHLARALVAEGHEVLLLARGEDRRDEAIRRLPRVRFAAVDTADAPRMARLLHGCGVVAHCAGINFERGEQTFERVHVAGTRSVVDGSREAGVRKLVLLSFAYARPGSGCAYHESKWQAEELVRESGLNYTIIKAGMIGGRGDHLLDHLSHLLHTIPVFASVGMHEKLVRPIAAADAVRVIAAAVDGRLTRQTISLLGPETMALSELVQRLAGVVDKRVLLLRLPVWAHRVGGWLYEHTMQRPLISRAQVKMLAEGMETAALGAVELPADLLPQTRFTAQIILEGLPAEFQGLRLARR